MINVLVVDDDKLVRKGIISVLPWQQFDMQVVGEANNGEKALELLAAHDVDLLLTDLAMPVMSGIELMRLARERFPELHIVVLTLHQDFAYIQEALRLGAIDYIAKVELEKDQMEEVLARIAARIRERTKENPVQRTLHHATELKQGYAVICLDEASYSDWGRNLKLPAYVEVVEVDRSGCLIFFEADDDSDLLQELTGKVNELPNSVLVKLSDLEGLTLNDIRRWMRDYMERELFYDFQPDDKFISVCIHREYHAPFEPAEEKIGPLKDFLMSAEWLYNDLLFIRLVRELKWLRMPQTRLFGLLYAFVNEWNNIFTQTMLGEIKLIQPIYSWFQIERWMKEDVRGMARLSAEKAQYSEEIIHCILRAEKLMHAEMERQLTAAEVAARMNMSRSYFSQCFKDIIGITFNEYIRKIRMDKAKQYLLSTNKTIQWIAENIGYMDEKYFSRTFRLQTGILPSEYRLRKRTEQS
ncbi:response regulator [Paenibacillus sp. GCM10027626]|uniref:response regulator n=1 Tax=Paenibacillus sp. GCM10027626 TaxID=3273411 RepID=UPI00362F27FD